MVWRKPSGRPGTIQVAEGADDHKRRTHQAGAPQAIPYFLLLITRDARGRGAEVDHVGRINGTLGAGCLVGALAGFCWHGWQGFGFLKQPPSPVTLLFSGLPIVAVRNYY